MQKRMYAYADSPAQKLLGIAAEAMGAASLAAGISSFNSECLNQLRYAYLEDDDSSEPVNPFKGKSSYFPSLKHVKIRMGPGFIAYIVGFIAALLRALLHLLTPLPHRGKGLLSPLFSLFSRTLRCGPGCCELSPSPFPQDLDGVDSKGGPGTVTLTVTVQVDPSIDDKLPAGSL